MTRPHVPQRRIPFGLSPLLLLSTPAPWLLGFEFCHTANQFTFTFLERAVGWAAAGGTREDSAGHFSVLPFCSFTWDVSDELIPWSGTGRFINVSDWKVWGFLGGGRVSSGLSQTNCALLTKYSRQVDCRLQLSGGLDCCDGIWFPLVFLIFQCDDFFLSRLVSSGTWFGSGSLGGFLLSAILHHLTTLGTGIFLHIVEAKAVLSIAK